MEVELLEDENENSSPEDINSDSLDETITSQSDQEQEQEGEGPSDFYNSSDGYNDCSSSTASDRSPVPSLMEERHKDTKLTRQELRKFYKLSSQITQHNNNLQEKKHQLEDKVEELRQCREDITQLKRDYTRLKTDLETTLKDNKVSSHLTKLELEKIHKEIAIKYSTEERIEEEITKLEIKLLDAEMSCAQFDSLQPLYTQQKRLIEQQKHKAGMIRVQTQKREVIEAKRRDRAREERQEKEASKSAHNKGQPVAQKDKEQSQYIVEKLARLKKEELAKEEEQRIYKEKRMKALLSLKKNIDSNRDALRAHQLLLKEKERRLLREENEERERVIAEGGDPDVAILRKRQLEQLEKDKQAFQEKQKQKQMEIVSRLLEEAKQQEKIMKKNQSVLSSTHAKKKKRRRKKSETVVQEIDSIGKHVHENEATLTEQNNKDTKDGEDKPEIDNITITQKEEGDDDDDGTLLHPNIPGLWEPVKEIPVVKPKHSKTEQALIDKTLKKLKDNIVRTQIAGGKEFKGQTAFLSKPKEIIFKDFELGQVYKKRLQLTNVSYTINHLKLIGASDNLKDFIEIEFNPPGPMSAGLTCPLSVTFEPKVNEDIVGSVDFLSQTGPFSITVKCLTKKCIIVVDKSDISFGTVCIGEEVRQSFTVHNKGALSTGFIFQSCQPTSGYGKGKSSLSETEGGGIHSNSQLTESQRSILSTVEYSSGQQKLLPLELHSHSMSQLPTTNVQPHTTGRVQFKDKTPTPVMDGEMKREGEERDKLDKRDKEEKTQEKDNDNKDNISEINKEKEEEKEDGNKEGTEEREDSSDIHHDVSIESDEAPPTSTPPLPSINIGEVMGGEIGPYSSIELLLIFTPTVPGDYENQFVLHTSSEPVYITATGQGIDVPIHTDREVVDLKICMTDRLYQDSITLYNRSRTALQATFSIPPPLSPHMEILPKYGLVQGESSFSAQLKFLPLLSILKMREEGGGELEKYFQEEEEERVMNVPISVLVAGQTNPVMFTVTAVVTESELILSETQLEFGNCTIHESVVTNIQLTNKSCLPQDYGFVHLPKWLSVQPNDGFGTLLPHETIELDVLFTPDKPQPYFTDNILCMTAINKQYRISANGTGIQPPLQLSHSLMQFESTPLNTTTVSCISVINPSLSRASSAVIRGHAPPRGPRLFEFRVPGGLPISVSPKVGIVKPGKSLSVEVSFSPRLDPQEIRDVSIELSRIAAEEEATAKKAAEERLAAIREEEKPVKGAKGRKGGTSRASNKSNSLASDSAGSTIAQQQKGTEEQIVYNPDSKWWEAYNRLLTKYKGHHYRSLIPCYISSPLINGIEHTTEYRSEEVLYLDVSATAIRPSLIVTSDNGDSTVDFGTIAIGSVERKSVQLKNISSEIIKLTATHAREEFEIRNAMRSLYPGSCHSLLLQFAPHTCGKYHETLHIRYGTSKYLQLTLLGRGVAPVISVTPDTGPIDWGHVMVGDTSVQGIHIENPSEVPVKFELNTERSKRTGVANCNGQPLFTCIPHTGVIQPGSSIDVSVQFIPDRPHCTFVETLNININTNKILSLELRGQSVSTNMYAIGGERVGADRKSMIASLPDNTSSNATDTSPTPSEHSLPLIFTFTHPSSHGTPKVLQIGSIKTPLVKKPKTEYIIESLQGPPTDVKCFTVDPMKGTLDPGELKNISITFNPQKDRKDNNLIGAHTHVILKGETTVQYQLVLQAVLSEL